MMDIAVNNVYKSYGDKKVLKDVSAVFPAGRCTCIMAESGKGKTTLLRLIMGLEAPDSGSITGVAERLSVVFQEDRLCGEFSIAANIRMDLNRDTDMSDDDIRRLMSELAMDEDINTPVNKLSGGMKRRVAIARAIAYDSEWLILDEPFKGLDEASREKVIGTITQKRKSVIMVSHNIAEAERMNATILDNVL